MNEIDLSTTIASAKLTYMYKHIHCQLILNECFHVPKTSAKLAANNNQDSKYWELQVDYLKNMSALQKDLLVYSRASTILDINFSADIEAFVLP